MKKQLLTALSVIMAVLMQTGCGQQVLPGMEVLRMIDVSRVKMKISIPEQDVAVIHVGQHATATVEASARAPTTSACRGLAPRPMP